MVEIRRESPSYDRSLKLLRYLQGLSLFIGPVSYVRMGIYIKLFSLVFGAIFKF